MLSRLNSNYENDKKYTSCIYNNDLKKTVRDLAKKKSGIFGIRFAIFLLVVSYELNLSFYMMVKLMIQ